ncbi:MAG: hypothetical protein LBJ88_03895 [Campylobacteraceae bacterium]|jgi:hypothetical protein|nr:hypothetical protein [Campylobacteraceae bacterium]
MKKTINVSMQNDLSLYFNIKTVETFEFLKKYGFTLTKVSDILVSYCKNDIEIAINYDRHISYEISADITIFEKKYSMGAIANIIGEKQFYYISARTQEAICMGLEQIKPLVEFCLSKILQKAPQFLAALEEQQKQWSKEFALNVLASQLRPEAENAFRCKDYLTAVELYERIYECLSPSEIKKVNFAKKQCTIK